MQSAAFEGVSGWVGIGDDGVRNNYSFEIVATSFSKRLTHVRYPKIAQYFDFGTGDWMCNSNMGNR